MAINGYKHIILKDPRLDRAVSKTWEHYEKYPFKLAAIKKPVPIIAGVDWMSNFDTPVWDTRARIFWIGKNKNDLGFVRGGHCVCSPQDHTKDPTSWWDWYNQLNEGKCVGEGVTRAASHFNRRMYEPVPTWNAAKEIDEWEDTNPGDDNGTSVNAGMRIWMTKGCVRKGKTDFNLDDGITAFRWINKYEDMLAAQDNPLYTKRGASPIQNSWGRDYPHTVWMPGETWQLLMDRYGEFAVPTDK